MSEFIEHLPKAELHLHLEGTLEPELKFELAARNGLELPYATVDEMRAAYDFDDLASFLAVYYEGMGVLLTEADFYDLAMAYFRKAHSQNVLYAEVFFDPQAHTRRGVAFETVVEGLHRAQRDAPLQSRLIMCFLRDESAASAMETFEQALPYGDSIVGVGLDSDEKGNPPVKFREVFERARREGFRLTMHCDVDQENSTAHIRQCLDDIRVERIDHGVNALEDASLIREINQRKLGLTVCPISNSYVAGSLKAPELRELLASGIRATVNSDDPAYFPGYVNENLLAIAPTADEAAQLARNSFAISWLEPDERAGYLDALDAYLERG
jgi:adenosine deaminase